jgi:hypothetical protein
VKKAAFWQYGRFSVMLEHEIKITSSLAESYKRTIATKIFWDYA